MKASRGIRLIATVLISAFALQGSPWLTGHAEVVSDGKLDRLVMVPSKQDPVSPRLKPAKTTEAFTLQQLDEADDKGLGTPSKTLQGSLTSIRVTKGRSQIIKFAQAVMRISIANEKLADIIPLAPDQIMVNGKERGVTSLIVWDENGQEGIFDLYIQNDTSELMDAVAAVAPNEKIQARVTDDSFILTGQVSNSVVLDEIRKTASAYGYADTKFVDLTDTPDPQVMLEVRVSEINRSLLKNMSVGWAANDFQDSGHPVVGMYHNDTTLLPDGATAGTIGRLGPMSTTVGGFTGFLAHQMGKVELQQRLDVLENKGKIHVLASPSLLCTHGRTASFLAGGEYPFVSGVSANGTSQVTFKQFGVQLKFTPWIAVQSGRISLKVEPEVSSIDRTLCFGSGASQVCGLASRKTSTTAQLKDGESLMISGLLSKDEQNTMAQIPGIGNLPILGAFFKNKNMSKSDRELIVIITPRIIKPNEYGKILGASN